MPPDEVRKITRQHQKSHFHSYSIYLLGRGNPLWLPFFVFHPEKRYIQLKALKTMENADNCLILSVLTPVA